MIVVQISKYIIQNNPMIAWPYRFFLGALYQIQKRIFTHKIMTCANGKKIILFPKCPISSQFIYSRTPDQKEIKLLREACSPHTCFLDIGANMGAYSILLLDKIESLLAFEPDSTSKKRLEKNLELNNFKQAVVEELALSNYEGEGVFSDDIAQPTNKLLSTSDQGRMVQVTTLDHYCKKQKLDPNRSYIVKIDVEGEEIKVIEGAKHFLKHYNIQALVFESFPENFFAAKKMLESLGYHIQHISHHNYLAKKA